MDGFKQRAQRHISAGNRGSGRKNLFGLPNGVHQRPERGGQADPGGRKEHTAGGVIFLKTPNGRCKNGRISPWRSWLARTSSSGAIPSAYPFPFPGCPISWFSFSSFHPRRFRISGEAHLPVHRPSLRRRIRSACEKLGAPEPGDKPGILLHNSLPVTVEPVQFALFRYYPVAKPGVRRGKEAAPRIRQLPAVPGLPPPTCGRVYPLKAGAGNRGFTLPSS